MKVKTGPRWGTRGPVLCPQKTLQEKDWQEKSSGRRAAVGTSGTSVSTGLGETTSGHFCAISAVPATSLLRAGPGVFFKVYNVLCMLKLMFQGLPW